MKLLNNMYSLFSAFFWTLVSHAMVSTAFQTNIPPSSSQHQIKQQRPIAVATNTEVVLRNMAGSFMVASTILSNVLIMAPVPSYAAAPPTIISSSSRVYETPVTHVMESSTTQLLAARSGGRAGGRSASSSSRSVSRPSSPTVIQRRTTVIQQPVYTTPNVIVSPGGYGYGGGYYSPQPSGLGLAIGLNAISGIGEGFREARQENEIRSTRDQLNDARVREAEMAVKIQQLEQMQQLQQQQLMTK